jgi:hypothetical protein
VLVNLLVVTTSQQHLSLCPAISSLGHCPKGNAMWMEVMLIHLIKRGQALFLSSFITFYFIETIIINRTVFFEI